MTNEEVEARVNSESNVLVKLGKAHGLGGNNYNHSDAGRKEGTKDLSPFMRELIAAATQMGTATSVAKDFSVSKAHAHNLKNGYITRSNGKSTELLEKKGEILGEIREKASDLIMETLGLVTPEKLRSVDKATDLTKIAKDLSTVVEKATPERGVPSNQTNILIYSPGSRDLKNFETIDVEPMEID